jgi:hypothetical protein
MLTEVTLLHRTTSDPTDYLIAANLKIRAERLVHISRKSQSPSLFWPRALQRTIVGHVSGYTFMSTGDYGTDPPRSTKQADVSVLNPAQVPDRIYRPAKRVQNAIRSPRTAHTSDLACAR